jgi:hypothetical protein
MKHWKTTDGVAKSPCVKAESDNIVTFDPRQSGRWRWPWSCEVIPFRRD